MVRSSDGLITPAICFMICHHPPIHTNPIDYDSETKVNADPSNKV